MRFRSILVSTAVVLTAAVIFVLWIDGPLGNNFHPVVQGEFYRSAQMSHSDLTKYIEQYHIQTVINLRGDSEKSWYRDEVLAAQKAGVVYRTVKLSAVSLPSRRILSSIIDYLRQGPYPVLVHCHGGADRSGLVSALFLMAIKNRPLKEAREQLSIRYGHIPGGQAHAMEDFFALYEQSSNGKKIVDWVQEDYER